MRCHTQLQNFANSTHFPLGLIYLLAGEETPVLRPWR